MAKNKITTRQDLANEFLRGLEDCEEDYCADHEALADAILTEPFDAIERMEELNRWPDSYSFFYSYRDIFN